jgi:hypothetical protein
MVLLMTADTTSAQVEKNVEAVLDTFVIAALLILSS